MNSFISMNDFTKDDILEILSVAKYLETTETEILKNKIIGSLFFEPSTRTRLSFTSAGYRLGAKILGFDSPDATSLKKGESLRDTIKMTEAYADLIVMRHNKDGAARFATDVSKIPVINAGDGSNEHPSQTLLDLYTIKKEFGNIENKKIAFIGDLKYGRTVHSLIKALQMFNCVFYFVAPKLIQIPEYITKELTRKGIEYYKLDDYKQILTEIDILYVTRVQRERFDNEEDYKSVAGTYKVNRKNILGRCKKEMIIMHPLPRVDEIDVDIDTTQHARYFEQAKNGVPIRKAIYVLALSLMNKKLKMIKPDIKYSDRVICQNEKCITKFEKTENKYIEKNGEKFCYYCNKEIVER